MDEDEFFSTVENQFKDLHNPDCENFKEREEITDKDGFELEVSGIRKDSDRWGEHQYAIDANVKFTVEDESDWEELEDEVQRLTDKLQNLIHRSIRFTGPVVVRSTGNPCERSWARRLVHEMENPDQEELEE